MPKIAYVDTSILLSIILGEKNGLNYQKHLAEFDQLWSNPLLESELLSALKREDMFFDTEHPIVQTITFVYLNQSLKAECRKILKYTYLRGADLHHLATALFFFPDPSEGHFLSLDRDQAVAARHFGFRVL